MENWRNEVYLRGLLWEAQREFNLELETAPFVKTFSDENDSVPG
jgi:hypothetical protein